MCDASREYDRFFFFFFCSRVDRSTSLSSNHKEADIRCLGGATVAMSTKGVNGPVFSRWLLIGKEVQGSCIARTLGLATLEPYLPPCH